MFASLKSKIKEETGNDISKLTSSWRAGNLLGRISFRDDTTATTTPSSSGGVGDTSTSESISPQLEAYLSDRTGGQIDQPGLQQQYTGQLEAKLRERDSVWERKVEELKQTLASVQSEEAAAAQAVARAAQADAQRAAAERDAAERQLRDLRARLAAAERAQPRLDALTEELEERNRAWSTERTALTRAAGAAEARAAELQQELELMRAALPPGDPSHHMHPADKQDLAQTGCEAYDRVCRERAVLARQLDETKMALADVKTSWSGQIAALETQVARLSRQAGEEGAERRRTETEKKELQEKLMDMTAELEKTKQSLANSEAKDKSMALQRDLDQALEEIASLKASLDNERTLVKLLQERTEKSSRQYDEQRAEVTRLCGELADLQQECAEYQKAVDIERQEKEEAFLRNAHMSQALELSRVEARHLAAECADLAQLQQLHRQLEQDQAACKLIKENEAARQAEVEELKRRAEQLAGSEAALQQTVRELEADICDKNKKIKTLDNRIADMKKTLQRELQASRSDHRAQEEQDISRRYLKHVVLRFLTARELEARQLTRALSVLLRLSAHEEALLRAALPPRQGISSWFPSLTNT
ncbi:golgin subfamily A member 1 isoform X1 [Plutella xylostella]|uniref:golgin subfamily A member 1 isoform X1 n=1 Tax=Plutella xylostella TaxID=51655 RepID=UPI00203240EA|nr:golgin subfamily A member 1 isoform X1 [Plutella xylostella]